MADVGTLIPQADIAYAAGFFDGEGCVQLYMRPSGRDRNCLRCSLSAAGSDGRPLYWLVERWGGTVKWDASEKRITTGRRPIGNWHIFGNQAEVFARDVLPYLIVKREQMDLWLEARALLQHKGWKKGQAHSTRITEPQREMRQDLVDRVKALKVVSSHR